MLSSLEHNSSHNSIQVKNYQQGRFYVRLSCSTARSSVSFRALGLLWYLKTHDLKVYSIRPKYIAEIKGCCEDIIYDDLNELANAGYVKKYRERKPNGTWGDFKYEVADEPIFLNTNHLQYDSFDDPQNYAPSTISEPNRILSESIFTQEKRPHNDVSTNRILPNRVESGTKYRSSEVLSKKENTPPTPKAPVHYCKPESVGVPFQPKQPKQQYREQILLTEDQYAELLKLYGQAKFEWMLDFLDSNKSAKGYKYDSDYHVLKPTMWVEKRYVEQLAKGKVKDEPGLKHGTALDYYQPKQPKSQPALRMQELKASYEEQWKEFMLNAPKNMSLADLKSEKTWPFVCEPVSLIVKEKPQYPQVTFSLLRALTERVDVKPNQIKIVGIGEIKRSAERNAAYLASLSRCDYLVIQFNAAISAESVEESLISDVLKKRSAEGKITFIVSELDDGALFDCGRKLFAELQKMKRWK